MRRMTVTALALAALALLACGSARAQQLVRLGAYPFPPYAVETADGIGGMVAELAAAMNAVQVDYVFKLVPTTATGRYADLAAGKIDAIAFEDPDWGWKGAAVEASDVFMNGEESYVALQAPGRGQSYFDDLADKTIAIVSGFHYGFAGFNADPAWLANHFSVVETPTPSASLREVLLHRADIAVVPNLLLASFVRRHPQDKDAFLVADKADQTYHLAVVLRRGGPIGVDAVNRLLATLKRTGTLAKIVAPHQP